MNASPADTLDPALIEALTVAVARAATATLGAVRLKPNVRTKTDRSPVTDAEADAWDFVLQELRHDGRTGVATVLPTGLSPCDAPGTVTAVAYVPRRSLPAYDVRRLAG